MPGVSYEPLAPQGEAPNLLDHSQLWVVMPEVRFLARLHLCLSYPSQCDPFTVCCERVVQLVFRSFPEGIVLYVAVDWLPVIDIPKEEKYSLPARHLKPMRGASA